MTYESRRIGTCLCGTALPVCNWEHDFAKLSLIASDPSPECQVSRLQFSYAADSGKEKNPHDRDIGSHAKILVRVRLCVTQIFEQRHVLFCEAILLISKRHWSLRAFPTFRLNKGACQRGDRHRKYTSLTRVRAASTTTRATMMTTKTKATWLISNGALSHNTNWHHEMFIKFANNKCFRFGVHVRKIDL